jgi:hypothetical protein
MFAFYYDVVSSNPDGCWPKLPEILPSPKIREIFDIWKNDDAGTTPDILACVLQQDYSELGELNGQSLTGVDAQLLSHLKPIAHASGFQLYLSKVGSTVTGNPLNVWEGYDNGYGAGQLALKSIYDLQGMPMIAKGLYLGHSDFVNQKNTLLEVLDAANDVSLGSTL